MVDIRRFVVTIGLLLALLVPAVRTADPAAANGLRFEVTVAPGLLAVPTDGRLLVVVRPAAEGGDRREPRSTIGDTGRDAPPLFGTDVDRFAPGVVGVVDQNS